MESLEGHTNSLGSNRKYDIKNFRKVFGQLKKFKSQNVCKISSRGSSSYKKLVKGLLPKTSPGFSFERSSEKNISQKVLGLKNVKVSLN